MHLCWTDQNQKGQKVETQLLRDQHRRLLRQLPGQLSAKTEKSVFCGPQSGGLRPDLRDDVQHREGRAGVLPEDGGDYYRHEKEQVDKAGAN